MRYLSNQTPDVRLYMIVNSRGDYLISVDHRKGTSDWERTIGRAAYFDIGSAENTLDFLRRRTGEKYFLEPVAPDSTNEFLKLFKPTEEAP